MDYQVKKGSLLAKANLLVVDDDEAITGFIKKILKSFSCGSCMIKNSAAEAIEYADKHPVDIIIMDIVFNNEAIDGSDAVLEIQKKINVPVVYISGYSDNNVLKKIKSTKSAWFLQKPFDADELKITIELALYNYLEDSLRRSEKRYQRIIQTISDYIYTVKIKDNQPVETIHGAACKAITGYSSREFADNPLLWLSIVPETEKVKVKEHFEKLIASADPAPIEHRIIRKDGRIRWIRNSPVFYFNSKGKLDSYDGIITDVTERKMAEEALLAQHEALEDLVAKRTETLVQVNAQLSKAESELRLKNERIMWDLQQAKFSQEIILPARPMISGFLVSDYIYEPMDMVGGDFLMYNQTEDGGMARIFLGDVAGHGVSAALYTHSIKAIAERLPQILFNSPQNFLFELNNNLYNFVKGSTQALFVAGLYGCFSKSSAGELKFNFSNAGNQYPLIYRNANQLIEEAVLTGRIMGHFENQRYEEIEIPLSPKDRIFIFTDGVNETRNEKKQELATEGLIKLLLSANKPGISISDTLKEIMGFLRDYRGKMPVQDDVVIFGAEVL